MKHIRSIDNIDNLKALIRHDLREYGIKVPKPKKSKRGGSKLQQDVSKSSVFGNYLAQVHCVHVPGCGYVAKFLVDAAEIILANVDCEGLFRKSGALSRQKEIRAQLDNGKGFMDANIYDVTALVKQFFRELPEPLFTSTYHDTFVRCYQLEDHDVARKTILMLCLMLPSEHISMLQFILKLLATIAANSSKNKMDSTNLAVVLAPNIMHVNSKSETMKSCEEKLLQVQTSVVEMLISSADQVGMVDNQLVERTQFMSEVFTTDDELDASEDNLEDTRENTKKEKKRKRSGSFQGFVSSIAQSITKWRRSTDGKTNTSGYSQGSNMSQVSAASGQYPVTASEVAGDRDVNKAVYQFASMENTPVVRRQKGATIDSRPFSASKRMAIIQNLPQHATLASTPYTPASTMKRMDINSIRRVGDGPSMPPRPYQCTPRHSMKTPRKKLALFSPASSMKKKRFSSTTNLSVQSDKKATKTKGIFRRLSGSKGDQTVPVIDPQTRCNHEVGQRLASPSSMFDDSLDVNDASRRDDRTTMDDSLAGSSMQRSCMSASVCEQSVISRDERASLNEGFIFSSDDKDVDISRMLSETVSEPALCGSESILYGSHDIVGDCVSLGSAVHLTQSETSICIRSTPKGHNRSHSAESVMECSLKMGLNRTTPNTSLRRGAPNTINVGLLHGDRSEVQKLRRSFGLDQSDIGYPIPVSVANMTCRTDIVCDDSLNDSLNEGVLMSDSRIVSDDVANPDAQIVSEVNHNSPVSVSQSRSTNSAVGLNVNPIPNKTAGSASFDGNRVTDESNRPGPANGYESDMASEAGLSTVPSGTTVVVPTTAMDKSDKGDPLEKKKTLAQQSYESVDSLFSNASACSPPTQLSQREMTRSISADSGKGSMCEEPMDDGDKLDTPTPTAVPQPAVPAVTCSLAPGLPEERPTMPNKKSQSSQDLQVTVNRTPGVARSKSLLDSSMVKKNQNGGRPNLQISADTHKLLARAGYIREQKDSENNEQDSLSGSFQLEHDDFLVPGQLHILKIPEDFNPRRESIIQLRKSHAGYVKSNIKQFDRISEKGSDVAERHASPFRFPSSTTRKRGLSPLTIPNLFSTEPKSGNRPSKCDDKLAVGTARVPISIQLIKPSVPPFVSKESICDTTVPIKRKPSIYYAKKEGISAINKYKNQANKSAGMDELLECDESNCSAMDTEWHGNNITNVHDTSKIVNDSEMELLGTSDKHDNGTLEDKSVEINQSLMETVNTVFCTPPLSEKLQHNGIGSINKENLEKTPDNKPNSQVPEIKLPLVNPLRTSSGKTPVALLKTSQSPRSPVKPLKRLGGSPRSPRCRNMRSPKLMKAARPQLTALMNQDYDLNNL